MNKAEISAAGFTAATRSPRRIIANIQGIKKSVGKTRLAMTAKKPVGYISVEIGGEEGVIDSFIPAGVQEFDGIQIARIRMEDPVYPDPGLYVGRDKEYDKAISDAVQTVAMPAMDSFYKAYYASLANMATTVVDTGTDVYQLARMADFGRLEKIPALAYTQVKRSFAKLFDDTFSAQGSCLWIHHMKDKGETFVNDKGKDQWRATGVYEMDGCMVVNDKVQAVIELWRDDLKEIDEETARMVKFHAMIVDSRHNADAMGQIFTNDFTFADIGMAIFPGSKRSDWE